MGKLSQKLDSQVIELNDPQAINKRKRKRNKKKKE